MAEKCDQNESSICTICLGDFRKPRTLLCTHSFCELCISEHIVSTATLQEQKTYNCPVCRYTVTIDDPTEDKSKWVSFLPLKAISNISQEIKQQNCHPCERLEKINKASKWCRDCNESLCQNCSDVHGSLKMTFKHRTVSIEDTEYHQIQTVVLLQSTSNNCLVHVDRRILYCLNHNSAICIQCLFDKHRQCEQINLIEKKEDIKEENVNYLKSQITKLQTVIKTLIEGKKENKEEISTTFSSIETQVVQNIAQIKTKLDDLYIEFLKKAGIKQDEIQDELDQSLKELNRYSAVLGELMQNIELVHLYGSKIQIFLVSKDIESKITDTVQNLEKLFEKDEHVQVKPNFGDLLQTLGNLKNLGALPEIRTPNTSIVTKTMREVGLDILIGVAEPEFSTIYLEFNSVLNIDSRDIRSCVHIKNDICAALKENSLSIVNAVSNETVKSITITANPKKLCYDSTSKMIYCSCNHNMGFQSKVDGNKLIDLEYCSFDASVCGLDVFDGQIYIIKDRAISQSKNFKTQSVWISGSVSGTGDDISIDKISSRFSVSVNDKHEILFGSVQDKSLKQTSTCRKFYNVAGIAFGPSGILFVAEQPSSIYAISNDEKSVKILVTKLQQITIIKDITVSRDNKKLYVCGVGGVEIYDILS